MSDEQVKKKQLHQAFHSQSEEEVLKDLNTSATEGLTESEAKKRLAEYGSNELDAGKKTTMLQVMLKV